MKLAQVKLSAMVQYQVSQWLGPDGDDFMLPMEGIIYGEADEEDPVKKIKLGDLKMYLVQVGNVINQEASLPFVLDRYQQIMDAGSALFNDSFDDYSPWIQHRYEEAFAGDNILLLDRLTLEPEVRGQRLGLAVLHRAILDWSSGCSFIVMKPFPLQYEGGKPNPKKVAELRLEQFKASKAESFRRLRNYYKRLGFERIGRSDIYARFAHDKMPTYEELSIPDGFTVSKAFFNDLAQRPEKK